MLTDGRTDRHHDYNTSRLPRGKKYETFLSTAIDKIRGYFNWRTWLQISEKIFLFSRNRDDTLPLSERIHFRLIELKTLIDCPHSIHPPTDNEKVILVAQYQTLMI